LACDGIIIQHGLTESMREAAQRAVDAGIKVVAFDVNVENEAIPQIEQSDYLLGRMALDQAIEDNGTEWTGRLRLRARHRPPRPPRCRLAGNP
jgi:simple sugar transport system substrate-binding protein